VPREEAGIALLTGRASGTQPKSRQCHPPPFAEIVSPCVPLAPPVCPCAEAALHISLAEPVPPNRLPVSATRRSLTTVGATRASERRGMNVCHCWLAQQWTPGTRLALLDEPAVAHGARRESSLPCVPLATPVCTCAEAEPHISLAEPVPPDRNPVSATRRKRRSHHDVGVVYILRQRRHEKARTPLAGGVLDIGNTGSIYTFCVSDVHERDWPSLAVLSAFPVSA
jgi:hypothetical protein